jgi:hypothetical protein
LRPKETSVVMEVLAWPSWSAAREDGPAWCMTRCARARVRGPVGRSTRSAGSGPRPCGGNVLQGVGTAADAPHPHPHR